MKILILLLGLVNLAYAGKALWEFTPNFSSPVTIYTNETKEITYTITNQTRYSYQLSMKNFNNAITSSGCNLPANGQCTLTLTLDGSKLTGYTPQNPTLCQSTKCYSASEPLGINLLQPPPLQYKVTPKADANGSISPTNTTTVGTGSSISFSANPNTGYQVNQWILDGKAVQTGGNSYQLSNINADHNITVNFSSIQYKITSDIINNKGEINPRGITEVKHGESITFTATAPNQLGVYSWYLDGNIAQSGGINYNLSNVTSDHNVMVDFSPIDLQVSVSSLALSINCLPSSSCTATQNQALTGKKRIITIRNNGQGMANNLRVENAGMPNGTSILNLCGKTLNGQTACTIEVTPGQMASSSCTASHTSPDAGTITVKADGTPDLNISVYVLGYGCQYQGGFVYAVDDTTPSDKSIGGKVASLVDQAAPNYSSGIIWSANENGEVDNTIILGIDKSSTTSQPFPISPSYPSGTPPYTACNGALDGACNSRNIVSYFRQTLPTYYAAGLCTATINNYSDWYLPAICEMSSFIEGGDCPEGIQNMENLSFLIDQIEQETSGDSCVPPSGTNCLKGIYWSSTEVSDEQQIKAAGKIFYSGGRGATYYTVRENPAGVRCSRFLTL